MRDDERSLSAADRKLVDAGTPPETTVHLRGAPLRLLRILRQHEKKVRQGQAEKQIFEVLVEGPGGTGKSFGDAMVMYWAGNRWPGMRMLVISEVRADLATTFQKVWEEDIVPQTHPMLARAKPIARIGRRSYNFWNGPQIDGAHPTVGATVIEIGGMDDVQRYRGTDYDLILFSELTRCRSEVDYTEFLRALRSWKKPHKRKHGIPFQVLLGETNPDSPDNWVNLRYEQENMQKLMAKAMKDNGVAMQMLRLTSKHEDNPKWYNSDTKEMVPEGRAYLAGLDAIPGPRGLQLRHGIWCAAEGIVYEFKRDTHIIERPKPRPIFRAFIAAMDWGYTDPCCLLVAGVDRDTGHLHIVTEIYRKGVKGSVVGSIDWWADRVIELKGEYNLRALVVDPSRPEVIDKFNRAVSSDPSTPFAIGAMNRRASSGEGDMGGIDTVRWYLEGGRLFFWADRMRYGPDEQLIEAKQPTNTCAEFGSYIYRSSARAGTEISNRRKELTDDTSPDHGMDALRYLCSHAKSRYGKVVDTTTTVVHISQRDREIARTMGIELPTETE